MAEEQVTPQPDLTHDVPSLPSSPHPKRTKYTEPAQNLTVASILNDRIPTPTPESSTLPDPMAQAPLQSQQLPSHDLAAQQSLPSMPPMALEPPPPALQVKFLSASAKAPSRGSAFAAGYDLYASKETVIPARGKVLVDTDISIAVPAGTYGRVAPRSGLASKHSIDVGAGVIDADYRGPLKVLLFNFSDQDFKVSVHERVAQLIVERIYTPDVVIVENLEETVRGAGGFGSTGGFGGTLPGINGVSGAMPPPA
ncbi:dUTP diphosphatase [Polychaeton citri CBS 116435]|uniref:Deoxyuridine 5'-triphosphate nucleotidohydrolase n=1 Tax=Polychaeton citri CBS 116435 TaxID=1314669 RepID=A0A9P4Q9X4_9PEZI|nr:dUTP diphosphatase [Polychaeton citri CBS 116435]